MIEYRQKDYEKASWRMLTEAKSEAEFSMIGDYKIIKMVGKGTFGKVFLGESIHTGQLAALKVMQKRSVNFDSVKIFERELKSLTRIRGHKNVLSLFEAFETKEALVLVTEWCDGGDLLALIRTQGALSERECKFLLRGLLEGLLYIHENHRIAHCDLKLENVFITRNGRVVVGDFGVSKDYITTLRTRAGSEEYAAPEKILGQTSFYAEEADVWSFGVIMYACLKAKLPFTRNKQILVNSDNPLSLYNQIMYKNIEINSVSEECRQVVLKALERNPVKRASFRELLNMPFFSK